MKITIGLLISSVCFSSHAMNCIYSNPDEVVENLQFLGENKEIANLSSNAEDKFFMLITDEGLKLTYKEFAYRQKSKTSLDSIKDPKAVIIVNRVKGGNHYSLKLGSKEVRLKCSTLIPNFTSPDSTIETYEKAYSSGDKVVVQDSFSPPAREFFIAPEGKRPIFECTNESSMNVSKEQVRSRNKKNIKPKLQDGDFQVTRKCKNNSYIYILRKFDQDWKIIDHSAKNAPL